VTGITTSRGDHFSAENVISNASPTLVFGSMISPKKETPARALQNINSRKLGFSLVLFILAWTQIWKPLGLSDYSYFIAPHMNTEKLYENIFKSGLR